LLKGDKKTYQMDPGNAEEALREVEWTWPKAPTA
jgi:porphobilinogen synthase